MFNFFYLFIITHYICINPHDNTLAIASSVINTNSEVVSYRHLARLRTLLLTSYAAVGPCHLPASGEYQRMWHRTLRGPSTCHCGVAVQIILEKKTTKNCPHYHTDQLNKLFTTWLCIWTYFIALVFQPLKRSHLVRTLWSGIEMCCIVCSTSTQHGDLHQCVQQDRCNAPCAFSTPVVQPYVVVVYHI